MINKLINMEVPKATKRTTKIIPNGNYTIQDYAAAFINGMGEVQRERFKKMLQNGIKCGMSVADNYGIEYEPFIEEEKEQILYSLENNITYQSDANWWIDTRDNPITDKLLEICDGDLEEIIRKLK